ncbi:peptide MFS transporter [Parahaliea mediterranea]|uniref:peptide MFS transporter n=1 Tax=Parahaliea mediterranea TaxID=651086 RepID=UPI000E2F97D3|nr:peptide MFS transporter [Parahaliea mediterranea]
MTLNPFRQHPPGLATCFAVEMWERFSYYGMRALLIYYLTQHFLFSDREGYLLYGAYTALVYMMPVIGGVIADRWLGARQAVQLGAILLVLGHFGMVFEGPAASPATNGEGVVRDALYLNGFFLSLALIITGVGFLKTNISNLVGALYPPHDRRRDAGFTLFYMGINLGAALAPLLCGWLGQTYGWGYGFGLAGIGMLFGLLVFLRGQRHFRGLCESPARTRRGLVGAYLAAPALVAVVWLALHYQQAVGQLLGGAGLLAAGALLVLAFRYCTPDERRGLLTCGALILVTIVFWAFYEQVGSSLNLFADRSVDRVVFGVEIPAASLQALPAIFVILFAPLISQLWLGLSAAGREPGTRGKFGLAIGLLSSAFLLLALGIALEGGDGRIALAWLVLNFALLSAGELCLSPVSLSMVGRLSPLRYCGFMMGVLFLAISAGNFTAGLIAGLTSQGAGDAASIDGYATVYLQLGLLAAGTTAALLLPSIYRRLRPAAAPAQTPEGTP